MDSDRVDKIRRKLLNNFLLFFLAILISGCITQKSTTYSNIPRPIRKKIEKYFEYLNVFFYNTSDDPNSFLYWYYKQSTAYWFVYNKGHLVNKGYFESNNGANNQSIYGTNNLVKVELDRFTENNARVLDGATFGYVINICSNINMHVEEMVCWTSIPVMGGDSIITNNFIENDLKKIINMNYKVTTINTSY